MQHFTRLLVLVGAVTMMNATGKSAGEEGDSPLVELDKIPTRLAVEANTAFAFDLYRQLAHESTQNLFFSPYSLSVALAMATEGARGGTALEMGRVLRFPDQARRSGSDAQLMPWQTSMMNASFAKLNARFNRSKEAAAKNRRLHDQIAPLRQKLRAAIALAEKRQTYEAAQKAQALADQVNALIARTERCEVTIANALWGEQSYPFNPVFTNTINSYFKTGAVFPCDFKNAAFAQAPRINEWVAKHTANRITNLIAANALSKDTKLVLTNAVYFKGEWADPFKEKQTDSQPFTLTNGRKINALTMHQWNSVPYAAFNGDGSYFDTPRKVPKNNDDTGEVKTYPDDEGLQILELPYHGKRISMVILVPRSIAGLTKWEEKVEADSYSRWLDRLKNREVRICLPKFKMESGYELGITLQQMGMRRAFTDPTGVDGADFSGMTTSLNPRLQISSVVHKAFVEVSEKGTEAAAASAVLMAEAGPPPPELVPFHPEFKADRPFLFFIRDRIENTVLFVGRVNDPR
jgi:serpin B